LIEKLFQFFIPSQCPCCDQFLGERKKGLCADCVAQVRWINPPFCSICGTPFLSREIESHPCGTCTTNEKYFTTARALGYYEGPLQEAIHRWKYQGRTSLTPLFGEWMAGTFRRYWQPSSVDLLVPVPLHPKRLRERGFNQALLLAKEISRRLRIPYRKRTLQKKKPTPPQVNLSGSEREEGVKGTFQVSKKEDLDGLSILLLDDVYTTGATVNECSKVLIAGGAKRVDVFTLAHAIKRN
jgi:ComF family protein